MSMHILHKIYDTQFYFLVLKTSCTIFKNHLLEFRWHISLLSSNVGIDLIYGRFKLTLLLLTISSLLYLSDQLFVESK